MFFVSRKKFDLEDNGHTKFMVSGEHYELQQNNIVKINPQKITSKIKHKVRFDVNGGDSVQEPYRIYTIGEKYSIFTSASKSDNRHIGWCKDEQCNVDVLSSDEIDFRYDTLYAKYLNLIPITFDCDGGQFPDSSQTKILKYAPGFKFSEYTYPPNPTKSGINFAGWYTQRGGSGTRITQNTTCPNNETTYYADWKHQTYTVNLNSQWQNPTKWTNTDSRFIVYESFSNYNVNNGVATMYVNITGYTSFTLYINSYAESNYDYTRAYVADSSTQLTSTQGYQYNPSSYTIDSGTGWRKVTYSLDGGQHQIKIDYKKDGSVNSNWDRGYVALPVQ